jgi:GTPase SAR1 family protein
MIVSAIFHMIQWIPEIKRLAPTKPIILIGTKVDERRNAKNPVTRKEGDAMAKKWSLLEYMECSATTNVCENP